MFDRLLNKVYELKDDKSGSAVGFILGLLIIGLMVANLAGEFAYEVITASENSSVVDVPGGSIMLKILAFVFFAIPVAISAKAIN